MPTETKSEREPKIQPKKPYIGAHVVFRLPGGGLLPMIVDRLDAPTVVSGVTLNSRVRPQTEAVRNVPYSRTDMNAWCWPEESEPTLAAGRVQE